MKQIVQKVVAGVAVVDGNKILIIQRAPDEDSLPNIWEFPSGKKEPLEKVEDAARRECKEETGLNVKIGRVVGVFNFGWEKENEIRDATEIVFLAKPAGNTNVILSDEHQNHAWVTKDEIDGYDASRETKRIAFEVLSDL